MLFADRTFSSISNIATIGFSKYARFLFNFITSWNYDSAASYVDCTYYKVLAMDVKDELIPYLSSLKVEVCKKVFIREISNNNDESVLYISLLVVPRSVSVAIGGEMEMEMPMDVWIEG